MSPSSSPSNPSHPNANPGTNPSPDPGPAGGTSATPGSPVITNVTRTKVNLEALYQTLVAGIVANLGGETSLALGGAVYTPASLVQRFQERIAAAEATKASKNQWHADVESERQVEAAVGPLRKGMQRYVEGRYGDQSAKLAEFGFLPRKPRKTSAATKAAAAVKAKATRAARHTMGKKQKKAIKAPVAAPPTAPTASSPAATPAPKAAPAAPTAAPTAPVTAASLAGADHPSTGGPS